MYSGASLSRERGVNLDMASPSALSPFRMNLPSRICLGIVATLLLAFCTFGFLATFEEPSLRKRLPWEVGYWVIAGCALGGLAYAARGAR